MQTPSTAVEPATATLDLLGEAHPSDPALDMALSHALLDEVAARRRAPALRVFRPGPTVAFGRLDALSSGFAAACAAARRRGYTPVVRSAGGHAAAYDERCVTVEHVSAEEHVTDGLASRFAAQAQRLRDALVALGADAHIGQLPGEYCPGAHSLNVAGRTKVAGIAQRAVRRAALTTGVVVVGGGPELRAVLEEVYAALGLEVDPQRAGALDEEVPGLTAEVVAAAVRDAYAADFALRPSCADAGLLAAAEALAPRHRVR